MMQEPKKPTKKIEVRKSTLFPFDYVSKKVSLSYFLNWVKENLPKGSKDITLELAEEWCYEDCITSLEVGWTEVQENTSYEKDMVKYEKKLKKWKKQNEK